MQVFTQDPEVVDVASHFLRLISFNFVASALIFTCSGIFQGLGHTWPALVATSSRIVTFIVPAIWISTLPGLKIDHVWYVSVASVWLQAMLSLYPAASDDEDEARLEKDGEKRGRPLFPEGPKGKGDAPFF